MSPDDYDLMSRYFQSALKNKFLNVKQMQKFGIGSLSREHRLGYFAELPTVIRPKSRQQLSHRLLADITLSLSLPSSVS